MEPSEEERILVTHINDLLTKFEEDTGLEVVDIDIVDNDDGTPYVIITTVDKDKM